MKYPVFHSIPETLTYFLVVLILIFNIIGLIITINILQNLKQQQTYFHNNNITSLKTIEQNQVNQTIATKNYINCLLTISPQGDLHNQEQACFDQAPVIMR